MAEVRRPLVTGRWRVQLLGGFRLSNGEQVIDGFGDTRALRLFARLALEPHAAHARVALAEWLTPDPDRSAAQRSKALSNALAVLKGRLNPAGTALPQALVIRDESLRLNVAAFDIDVDRFETLVRQRQWQAARDLWRGELLPGQNDPAFEPRRSHLAALLTEVDHALAAQLGAPPPEVDAPPPLAPYVTPFIGREAERAMLAARLTGERLLVLHGPAGVGKTRLALLAAGDATGFAELLRVPLAPGATADDVLDQMALALDLLRAGRGAVAGRIAARLQGRPALLVLDDAEALEGPALAALCAQLQQALPRLHLLVTTRRLPPDLPVIPLDPLPLPAAGAGARAAAGSPAVRLFVQRAQSVRGDFKLSERNVAQVVAVCRVLQGLPLAIELAAAQVRRVPLAAMADKLADDVAWLKKPAYRSQCEGRDPSLQATLQWSWDGLDDEQRRLVRALAVFAGGFTVAQAVAVAGDEAAPRGLQRLSEDALLRPLPAQAGGARFELLLGMREFVTSCTEPAARLEWRRRHRAVFAELARARAERPLPAADQANLRAAIASALDDGAPEAAAALCLALVPHWRAQGAGEPERRLLLRCAGEPRLAPARRAVLLAALAGQWVEGGQGALAHEAATEALALAGRDGPARAHALLAAAAALWRCDADGPAALQRVLAAEPLLPAQGEADLRARWHVQRGTLALMHENDAAAAARHAAMAEAAWRDAGDRQSVLEVLPLATAIPARLGQHEQALASAQAGLQRAEQAGQHAVQLLLLNRVANAFEALHRYAAALQVAQAQCRLAADKGAAYHLAIALWNQPALLAVQGRGEDAVCLMGFARGYWRQWSDKLTPAERADLQALRDAVQLPAADFKRLYQRGLKMPLDKALALAAPPLERERARGA